MDASIDAATLKKSLGGSAPPLVIDVRRGARFLESPYLVKGALRRDPERVADWKDALPRAAQVVVYCVHGHEVSQSVAKALGATFLEGGIEGWRKDGGELAQKPQNAATRWVTRERPKIDRIACPWLVKRFVDPDAEFLYVAPGDVKRVAQEKTAVPYDVPGVEFGHDGDRCSFDAFLKAFHLEDPALQALARIVRAADTGHPEAAPQAPGLLAISQGLSANFADDHEMLRHGIVIYDALYAWCRK